MTVDFRVTPTAIAVNRFGLGARPDEPLPSDPHAWLSAQLTAYQSMPAPWAAQPHTSELFASSVAHQQRIRAAADADKQDLRKEWQKYVLEIYRSAVNARTDSALTTSTPFAERLVHFWANHFAVSSESPEVGLLAGSFEAEAIRPHVMGRFADMLVAVEQHPAMQYYLNQVRSTGPDSPLALRVAQRNPQRAPGLNENLAREIMELHTLGARSGYTQTDVTEFARAMTGWSIGGINPNQKVVEAPGEFVFRAPAHEPGSRTILGRTYNQYGADQALAVLQDFAASSATADHIAGKLARHFVADTPPPALVARLSRAFRGSGGDLPTVYQALIDAPEAWPGKPSKFKTPWDWSVSTWRGLGWRQTGRMQAAPLLTQLGQPVWRPGSPAGYDDIAASWAAPDALVLRVGMAQRFAAQEGDRIDPRTLGDKLLPGSLSSPTSEAIGRAESATTGLALLLVSPDFQRT
jgi:uncharacterized protein (DUF1800 family)